MKKTCWLCWWLGEWGNKEVASCCVVIVVAVDSRHCEKKELL